MRKPSNLEEPCMAVCDQLTDTVPNAYVDLCPT